MFARHAYQFVALCLAAVVTVSLLAGVNTMATPAAPAGVFNDGPVALYA